MKAKEAIRKSFAALYNSMPIFLGVIMLIGLVKALAPKDAYNILFGANIAADSIIGGFLGSILTGNPVTSYIIGGEFLAQGVSLIAVTTFIVAWVTVGVLQLPAESMMLGKRFAVLRNISSFILSVIVALITVLLVGLI